MSDDQDRAEALDDDVLADDEADIDDPEPTGDGRFAEIAGLEDEFPPEQPLGAEDPGRYAIDDDIATREMRQDDEGPSDPAAERARKR